MTAYIQIFFSVPSWHLNFTQILYSSWNMLCIFSTWIHKSPPRLCPCLLCHSLQPFTDCTYFQYTDELFFFFAGLYYSKVLALHRFFFTQTVLSSDDRNLSSTYTVSFTTFSSNLMTFSNKLPRLVNVQCSVCLVIQEFKMSSHYLHPLYPCSLCTKSNITWTL